MLFAAMRPTTISGRRNMADLVPVLVVVAILHSLCSTAFTLPSSKVLRTSSNKFLYLPLEVTTRSGVVSSSTTKSYATIQKKGDEIEDIEKQKVYSKSVDDVFNNEKINELLLGKSIPYEELTIGVLKETYPGENRVSQTPDSIATLIKAGLTVVVQAGGTLFCR